MLIVKGLSKHFDNVHAVKDVSFQVKKGKTFAFLGTNGAGKSTVIYMLINLLTPDKGSIVFAEKELIGIVFQSNRLDEQLTIEENLIYRAKLYGLNKNETKNRIDILLKLTHLESRRNHLYGKCSGGERRKADMIRALIHHPTFLILDEPTIGLDANSRKEIWTILDQLQREEGLTIFLTTHYIEEAECVDYVLILNEGKIEVEGTPKELREKYSSTRLILYPNNRDTLFHRLRQQHHHFEDKDHYFLMTLLSSKDAIPILSLVADEITSFTIQEASLEHVFLQVTKQLKSRDHL